MGLLDNFSTFARMNPEARNIANEMSSYMDSVSSRQKQQYSDMFKNSGYQPAQIQTSNLVQSVPITSTNKSMPVLRSAMGGK